ncbi:hypothetical protein K525DRAFT_250813 [Schizophyllum commune Loenen D]|nr:hypothetical protein K525DRAFT_250813 [Schizophyllum commune Loenen D]
MRFPRFSAVRRISDDADELHHGGEGEGDLHCITGKARHERIDQTYEIAAAGPLQKKRKLNEEAMQSKATHTGLQGTERRLDPPRSKSMPKAVASPIDASRHNAPREESLRQITVDIACQVLQTLPKLDTPLSVTPPADAITYGPRVDQKMGFYNLHYILMSAIFEIHEPDTLSAYGASMLISGLSSQEVHVTGDRASDAHSPALIHASAAACPNPTLALVVTRHATPGSAAQAPNVSPAPSAPSASPTEPRILSYAHARPTADMKERGTCATWTRHVTQRSALANAAAEAGVQRPPARTVSRQVEMRVGRETATWVAVALVTCQKRWWWEWWWQRRWWWWRWWW